MQIKKVKFTSSDVRDIYFDSCPKNERMPFPIMVAMSKLWNTDFWGFYDNDTLCGFVYLAHNRKIVFVMFLAVDKLFAQKVMEALYCRKYKTSILTKKSSFLSSLAIIMLPI